MQLSAYLDLKNLTDEEFAEIIGDGCSPWAVRKWRYGQRLPKKDMQIRIREVTKGRVTANDLLDATERPVKHRAQKVA